MECHKCQHNNTGNEACLTCVQHTGLSNHGRTHVSLDAMPPEYKEGLFTRARTDFEAGKEVPEALQGDSESPHGGVSTREAVDALWWFCRLTSTQREIVVMRIVNSDISYRQISARLHITFRRVVKEVEDAIRMLPFGASERLIAIIRGNHAEVEDA